jgi:hypothetical protein
MHLWFEYADGSERFVAGSDLSLWRIVDLKLKLEQKAKRKIVGHRLIWHAKLGSVGK